MHVYSTAFCIGLYCTLRCRDKVCLVASDEENSDDYLYSCLHAGCMCMCTTVYTIMPVCSRYTLLAHCTMYNGQAISPCWYTVHVYVSIL